MVSINRAFSISRGRSDSSEGARIHAPAVEGRRERKKRERHDRIYHAARQLFAAHGFEATTVEQIADVADVAPATFFKHFPTKNAVLAEMAGEVFERLQALIDEQLARPVSAHQRIEGFADRVASEVARARGVARDVLLELMRTSARPGEAVPYLSRVHEPFAAIIREGQRKGEIRTDLDSAFLAEVVVGAFNAAFINWMNFPRYPLEERLRQTAGFVSEAIQSRAPRTVLGSHRGRARG